jgi:hypothetical protein
MAFPVHDTISNFNRDLILVIDQEITTRLTSSGNVEELAIVKSLVFYHQVSEVSSDYLNKIFL